jgi:hypothetical protein
MQTTQAAGPLLISYSPREERKYGLFVLGIYPAYIHSLSTGDGACVR